MTTVSTSGTLRRTLVGEGEGKLRVVEKPIVLAWIAEPLGEGSSRERLLALVDADRTHTAMVFLAYSLPEREAVWWGRLAVAWAMPELSDEDREALTAAEAWVRNPDEATRRACLDAGKRIGRRTPAAAVAFGVIAARLAKSNASRAGRWVHVALDGVLAARDPGERNVVMSRLIESACDIAAGGAGRIPVTAPRVGSA